MQKIGPMSLAMAIKVIERTYPPDAQAPFIADQGRRLLERAKRETQDWRDLPPKVLRRMAELCVEHVEMTERSAERARER